jgi:hypothetical protein
VEASLYEVNGQKVFRVFPRVGIPPKAVSYLVDKATGKWFCFESTDLHCPSDYVVRKAMKAFEEELKK